MINIIPHRDDIHFSKNSKNNIDSPTCDGKVEILFCLLFYWTRHKIAFKIERA